MGSEMCIRDSIQPVNNFFCDIICTISIKQIIETCVAEDQAISTRLIIFFQESVDRIAELQAILVLPSNHSEACCSTLANLVPTSPDGCTLAALYLVTGKHCFQLSSENLAFPCSKR